MKKFEEKKFTIPTLNGISQKSIDEHLKLYAGYVKHANLILEKIAELSPTPEDADKNVYTIGELQRRFGFEFDGMRNHEYYFEQFEGGLVNLDANSALAKKIVEDFGSIETAINRTKAIAMTRGIGWSILYYDQETNRLLNAWIDEQHLGHLTGVKIIVALDMWEHSYMLDYAPSEKKKYVDAFFQNVNGKVLADRFDKIVSGK